jgi:hypothetical protein
VHESHGENGNQATLDRKAVQARERRARKRARREAFSVLDAMKVLELENAVKRAPRSRRDAAGGTLRLKGNVVVMVRQLIFWEEKGRTGGSWIYKSREEWCQEADTTYRMLTPTPRTPVPV